MIIGMLQGLIPFKLMMVVINCRLRRRPIGFLLSEN